MDSVTTSVLPSLILSFLPPGEKVCLIQLVLETRHEVRYMRKTTIVCTIGPGVIPILISNFKNTDDVIERAEQIVKNTG